MSRQFTVYENLYEGTQERYPYYLDVQHEIHDRLRSRIVVPLSQDAEYIKQLSPEVVIDGVTYCIMVPEMFSVPTDYIGAKVADLTSYSPEIINAIDLLITGF